jgi:hypothetical protein
VTTPRYFAPRSDEPPTELPLFEPESVVSVLGSLRVSTSHGTRAEWVITRMLSGALVPLPTEERDLLPPRLQQVLASHEVAGGATLELDARTIHLFEIELLEQSPDAPGLDDPIYLYGALSGPFPSQHGAPSCVRRGQLTVTRGDLLAGLCRGVRSPFVLPPENGTTKGARAISAVLPGDRDVAIQAGEGMILALPLLPAEIAMNDASNELIVTQLIHDVLAMLRDDARAAHPEHPLAQLALPVPSRAALESRLESDGWSIEGDVATQKLAPQKGFAGVLASVLHPIAAERKTLPPEASLDQFVALAEQVLPTIPGWPTTRARALAARFLAVASSSLRGAGAKIKVPAAAPAVEPAAQPYVPPPDARVPRPKASTPRGEWMKDFVGGPASKPPAKSATTPERAKPRLTPTTKAAKPPSVPDWMNDFDVDDHDD